VQLPHTQLDVQVCVPQLPHPCVAPGEHRPSPVQVPLHVQELVQDSVPQSPHVRVEPGAHTPSPVQVPQDPQVQSAWQILLWVPQLPQAWFWLL